MHLYAPHIGEEEIGNHAYSVLTILLLLLFRHALSCLAPSCIAIVTAASNCIIAFSPHSWSLCHPLLIHRHYIITGLYNFKEDLLAY